MFPIMPPVRAWRRMVSNDSQHCSQLVDGIAITHQVARTIFAMYETQVLASMSSLPEDKKLAEVGQQLEEEVEKLEEKVKSTDCLHKC